MSVKIDLHGANLSLQSPFDEIVKLKCGDIPKRRWNNEKKIWLIPPILINIEYLLKWFPDARWTDSAKNSIKDVMNRKELRQQIAKDRTSGLIDSFDYFPFKVKPFKHQAQALTLGSKCESFAYLMDQGTGKTKVCLDDASYQFMQGKITALLVICPNSVKTNWINPNGGEDEVGKHLTDSIEVNKGCWISNPTGDQKQRWDKFWSKIDDKDLLHILSINVECIAVPRIYILLEHFIMIHKVMIVVDESTRIKNRTAKRTKAAIKLRKDCKFARIMSGTPLIKSPLDAWSQFGFLDRDILGHSSYYAFRGHYAYMGGWQGRQVMSYHHLDELSEKIHAVSFRILKEDCLDLPPKSYMRRRIIMTQDQKREYHRMQTDCIAFIEDAQRRGVVIAAIVLTQLLRLQQITSGFLPLIDSAGDVIDTIPIGKSNPKIDEAIAIIQECQHKVIVWGRFIPELKMISVMLSDMGIGNVLFYGGTKEGDRIKARESFQDHKSDIKVFIGQSRTGGVGLNLHAARTVIYISNSFSTEDRVQSEDRAHRIGQEHPVQYIDLLCPGTIDMKLISVLRDNKRLSDEIMKDGWKVWI